MKIEIESRFSIFGNVSGFFRSGVETSLIKIGNMCSLKGFRDSHSSLSGAKQALPVLQNNLPKLQMAFFLSWTRNEKKESRILSGSGSPYPIEHELEQRKRLEFA